MKHNKRDKKVKIKKSKVFWFRIEKYGGDYVSVKTISATKFLQDIWYESLRRHFPNIKLSVGEKKKYRITIEEETQ